MSPRFLKVHFYLLNSHPYWTHSPPYCIPTVPLCRVYDWMVLEWLQFEFILQKIEHCHLVQNFPQVLEMLSKTINHWATTSYNPPSNEITNLNFLVFCPRAGWSWDPGGNLFPFSRFQPEWSSLWHAPFSYPIF